MGTVKTNIQVQAKITEKLRCLKGHKILILALNP